MATRQTAEAKIAAIQDKGNNTAQEVRDVLTELLDYAENQPFPPAQDLEVFHYWAEDPISDSKQLSSLYYSFKGIEGNFVNFTFVFILDKIAEGDEYIYEYKFDDTRIYETLKHINQLDSYSLDFIVAGFYGATFAYPVSLRLRFTSEQTMLMQLLGTRNQKFDNSLRISTSIAFHYPGFNLKKK